MWVCALSHSPMVLWWTISAMKSRPRGKPPSRAASLPVAWWFASCQVSLLSGQPLCVPTTCTHPRSHPPTNSTPSTDSCWPTVSCHSEADAVPRLSLPSVWNRVCMHPCKEQMCAGLSCVCVVAGFGVSSVCSWSPTFRKYNISGGEEHVCLSSS